MDNIAYGKTCESKWKKLRFVLSQNAYEVQYLTLYLQDIQNFG